MKYEAGDHTFVVCAYGECVYIEECIRSLLDQKIKSNIIICTSTPSRYISDIADKYGLKIFVNEKRIGSSSISADWNFAMVSAVTPLVTIAHQDDIYKPDYTDRILKNVNMADKPLIAFTDYAELRNGEEVGKNRNLIIKRIMMYPLRNRRFWDSKFIRRCILSFGSPICCPSVTYVKDNLPEDLFVEGYKVNLDWQAWERISRIKGDFVYINEIITLHRIHEDSETTKNINNSIRTAEDYDMLCKFWPEPFARIIGRLYSVSEKQNSIG